MHRFKFKRTKAPVVEAKEQQTSENGKNVMDAVIDQITELHKTVDAPKLIISDTPNVTMIAPSEYSSDISDQVTSLKETIDNSDISDIIGLDIDITDFERKIDAKIQTMYEKIEKQIDVSSNMKYECNYLDGILLEARETARFTLMTKNTENIVGFNYNIKCKQNVICSSHIETIDGNKVSIIINNLNNKQVSIGIQYIAVF
jgi:hypothetical protein